MADADAAIAVMDDDDEAALALLLEFGLGVNQRLDPYKSGVWSTPVALASRSGATDCLMALLRAGGDANGLSQAGQGTHPLLMAAESGVTASVLGLLSHGADPLAKDPVDGRTALHHAATRHNVEMLEALIRAGCPLEAVDSQGLTPLLAAASSSCQACSTNSARTLAALVEAGADARAKDVCGRTALHHCAGEAGALTAILQASHAVINETDDIGDTPLFLAATCHRSVSATRMLLDAGALVDSQEDSVRDGVFLDVHDYCRRMRESRAEAAAEAPPPSTWSMVHSWSDEFKYQEACLARSVELCWMVMTEGAWQRRRAAVVACAGAWFEMD